MAIPSLLPTVWNASKRLTNFIFANEYPKRTTTPKPIIQTTIRSFWSEWNLLKHQTEVQNSSLNENIPQKTTEIPSGMREILDEYSTTPKTNENEHSKRGNRTLQSTPAVTKHPTRNSFWQQWSALNPIDNQHNRVGSMRTTAGLPNWMKDTTVESATKNDSLLPWMQDIHDERSSNVQSNANDRPNDRTTTRKTVTEMPSWMQSVLNELSTTKKNPLGFDETSTEKATLGGNLIDGGLGDIHLSSGNRYSVFITRILCKAQSIKSFNSIVMSSL